MTIEKTPLNIEQWDRLNACFDINPKIELVMFADIIIMKTTIHSIEIKYLDGNSETIYPNDETWDFIVNGIKLERNKNNG